jgi:hypothetical protein
LKASANLKSERLRTNRAKHHLTRRGARRVGLVGLVAAVLLPLALWHGTILAVAQAFRLDLGYFVTGWTAWLLIAGGLVCFVPAVISIGLSPYNQMYPRNRNGYIAWGASLYVMGCALASQMSQMTHLYPHG